MHISRKPANIRSRQILLALHSAAKRARASLLQVSALNGSIQAQAARIIIFGVYPRFDFPPSDLNLPTPQAGLPEALRPHHCKLQNQPNVFPR
eukprot:m.807848 g.807848  ORF g.807848 m.807848 type:complete len:93 (-) comp59308_c0_seq8:461-739(-)